MPQGKVKFFNRDRGYGFIEHEAGDDLFFHYSDVNVGQAYDGANVEFVVGQGKKGPAAKEVKVIS